MFLTKCVAVATHIVVRFHGCGNYSLLIVGAISNRGVSRGVVKNTFWVCVGSVVCPFGGSY